MFLFVFLFSNSQSLYVSRIPSTGTPPETYSGSAAIYNELTNSIITIGGERISDTKIVSDVYIFDLTYLKWSSPRIISDYKPSGMRRHRAYLRKDRKIIVLGAFKEVLLFDLNDYSWSQDTLIGDNLNGIYSFAMTNYTDDNGIELIAIFGGSTQYAYSDSLYL